MPGHKQSCPEPFPVIRALVAEDNELNRKILVEMLKQQGVESDIAVNGLDAVRMVRSRDYSIVFMDIEMPQMDGYTAAKEIRNLGTDRALHMPIIAMTAHTLDAEHSKKYLDALMNGHLAKPVDRKALGTMLQQWLVQGRHDAFGSCAPDTDETPGTIFSGPAPLGLDMDTGLSRLGGNRDLYLKILHTFVERYGNAPDQLRKSLEESRWEEAIFQVHSIRGVAGNLGGTDLAATAAELETACRTPGAAVPSTLEESMKVFANRHEELIAAIHNVLQRYTPNQTDGEKRLVGKPEEFLPLLEQLKDALWIEEPQPCKEILSALRQRQWPADQEAHLAELHRLVQSYRLGDAFKLLEKYLKRTDGKVERIES